MKAFWHTWTLFIQAEKYKWSYKFDHCQQCKTCNFKHKGRWLCTSCWDKERANNPKRIEVRKKAWKKWHEIHKPRKPREEWKPMWQKPTWFDQKSYQHEWYMKNRDAILFLKKWAVCKRLWKPVLEIMWKHIPYIDLEKPKNIDFYDEWKKNSDIFDKVKKYLTKHNEKS